jgi:hypothetical protein
VVIPRAIWIWISSLESLIVVIREGRGSFIPNRSVVSVRDGWLIGEVRGNGEFDGVVRARR